MNTLLLWLGYLVWFGVPAIFFLGFCMIASEYIYIFFEYISGAGRDSTGEAAASLLGILIGIVIIAIAITIYKHRDRIDIESRKPPSLTKFKDDVINLELENKYIEMIDNQSCYPEIRTRIKKCVEQINEEARREDKLTEINVNGINKAFHTFYDKSVIDEQCFCLTKGDVLSYYFDNIYTESDVDEILLCCKKLIIILLLGEDGYLPSWFFKNEKGFCKSDYNIISKVWFELANNLIEWINIRIIKRCNYIYIHKNRFRKNEPRDDNNLAGGIGGYWRPTLKTRVCVSRSGYMTTDIPQLYKYSVESYLWEPMIRG